MGVLAERKRLEQPSGFKPITRIELRPIDVKRLANLHERSVTELKSADIGYIYAPLAQCFLPYRDQVEHEWVRRSGEYSIILQAGIVEDDDSPTGFRNVGLPFGAKPRLFQTFISTRAVKIQSRIVPLERTMTEMMRELGLEPSGGAKGPIGSFKEQIMRFSRASYTIVGPGPKGGRRYVNSTPVARFDVFFSADQKQKDIWPHELELTSEFFEAMQHHAVPISFPALRSIQQKPRAIDIYLWLTQRLCRIPSNKPLLLKWRILHEMFGGTSPYRRFKQHFREDMIPVRVAYPEARLEEKPDGFFFTHSPPPIPPKTRLFAVTK